MGVRYAAQDVLNMVCAVEDSELKNALGKISVVEGRYVVCCVLGNELKECGIEISCVDRLLPVGLSGRPVSGNAMCW